MSCKFLQNLSLQYQAFISDDQIPQKTLCGVDYTNYKYVIIYMVNPEHPQNLAKK